MNRKFVFSLSALLVFLIPSVGAAQTSAGAQIDQALPLYQMVLVKIILTAFLGIALFAVVPDWSRTAVRTSRGSPLFSLGLGIPGVLAFLGLWLASMFLLNTFVGIVVAIPLAVLSIVLEFVWGTIGYITLGTIIVSSLGKENIWLGIFIGALLSGSLVAIPFLGAALEFLILALGIGASARVTIGIGGVEDDDRVLPPATRT